MSTTSCASERPIGPPRPSSRSAGRREGWRSPLRRGASGVLFAVLLASSTPALADEYDSTDSGHPVRIVAYALHPVGVLLDYLLLRPAHWIAHREPFSTVFGHED